MPNLCRIPRKEHSVALRYHDGVIVVSMDETRFTLRVPDPLLERLRAAAERDRRSVHAQILHILETALDQENCNG